MASKSKKMKWVMFYHPGISTNTQHAMEEIKGGGETGKKRIAWWKIEREGDAEKIRMMWWKFQGYFRPFA